jgi:hypothetical protein
MTNKARINPEGDTIDLPVSAEQIPTVTHKEAMKLTKKPRSEAQLANIARLTAANKERAEKKRLLKEQADKEIIAMEEAKIKKTKEDHPVVKVKVAPKVSRPRKKKVVVEETDSEDYSSEEEVVVVKKRKPAVAVKRHKEVDANLERLKKIDAVLNVNDPATRMRNLVMGMF